MGVERTLIGCHRTKVQTTLDLFVGYEGECLLRSAAARRGRRGRRVGVLNIFNKCGFTAVSGSCHSRRVISDII